MRVLDAGCGVGLYALWAARAGANVVAVDVGQTHLARRLAEANRLADRIRWVRGDLARLQRDDLGAPFDLLLPPRCDGDPRRDEAALRLAAQVVDRFLAPGGPRAAQPGDAARDAARVGGAGPSDPAARAPRRARHPARAARPGLRAAPGRARTPARSALAAGPARRRNARAQRRAPARPAERRAPARRDAQLRPAAQVDHALDRLAGNARLGPVHPDARLRRRRARRARVAGLARRAAARRAGRAGRAVARRPLARGEHVGPRSTREEPRAEAPG